MLSVACLQRSSGRQPLPNTPVVGSTVHVCVSVYPPPLSLQCLTHMSVSGNHLESLPVEVGELRNLLELNLEGNDLKRCAHHWVLGGG